MNLSSCSRMRSYVVVFVEKIVLSAELVNIRREEQQLSLSAQKCNSISFFWFIPVSFPAAISGWYMKWESYRESR